MDILMEPLSDGVMVVKVSGMYRYGRQPQAMIPLVRRVMKQRDGRAGVWGSDWPYVHSTPGSTSFNDVDVWENLNLLKKVAEEYSDQHWNKLMRDNAALLFDQ